MEKRKIGKRLKSWRQAMGMSAYKLAKLTGVHPSFISNLEADRRPLSEEFMKKLSAIPDLRLPYQTLRVWKIQADYNYQEIVAAFQTAQEELGGAKDPSSADNGTTHRFAIKWVLTGTRLTVVKEPVFTEWCDLSITESKARQAFCIRIVGSSAFASHTTGGTLFLVIPAKPPLISGKTYLVEQSNPSMPLCLMRYEADSNQLFPVYKGNSAVSVDDKHLKQFFQVLYSRSDWN